MLINGEILIDTGWNAVQDMLNYGLDPNKVNYLFVTHFHQDHYIGLPQLLFYHAFAGRKKLNGKPLVLAGPRPELRMVYDRACIFLRCDHDDEMGVGASLLPLGLGQTIETPDFIVKTAPTMHPVTGLCYRFEEKASGKSIVVTGDTGYLESIALHASNADLLVHDTTCAAAPGGSNTSYGHSGAPDAAKIAGMANVGRLALIHYTPSRRVEALEAAKAVFHNSCAPLAGETLEL